jgi:hypothetical protein
MWGTRVEMLGVATIFGAAAFVGRLAWSDRSRIEVAVALLIAALGFILARGVAQERRQQT